MGTVPCQGGAFMVAERGDASGNSCSPGYWQLNYGVPQYGRSYLISIEVDSVQGTEDRIMKIAADSGAIIQSGGGNNWGGGYGSGKGRSKSISFSAEEAKAEKFAQKIITEGRLIQYSSNPNMQSSMYAEAKKKSDMLEEELRQNKRALDKMPIASCILGELQERYGNFLRGYDNAKNKASLTVNLSEKAPARETSGGVDPKK